MRVAAAHTKSVLSQLVALSTMPMHSTTVLALPIQRLNDIMHLFQNVYTIKSPTPP